MNDTFTPATTEQSGAAPVNAFVAALAEQVFQRVAKLVDEKFATFPVATATAVTIDEQTMNRVKTLVDERVSSYVDDLGLPDQQEVESMVENYIDNHVDFGDAVNDALDSIDLTDKIDIDDIVTRVKDDLDIEADVNTAIDECIDEKVRGVIDGLTFSVEVS